MNLESILIDDNYFQIIKSDSGKVWVFTDSRKFILIPDDFYSVEFRDQYFKFSHELSNDEILIENSSIVREYHILFALKEKIKNKIEKKFPSAKFLHYATALSSKLLTLCLDNKPGVLINRQKSHFYLLICNYGELTLLNSFDFKHDNDISYFTLNGLRDAGIDISLATVWYSGLVRKDDDVIKILRNYIPNVEILPFEGNEGNIDPEFKYFRFNQVPI